MADSWLGFVLLALYLLSNGIEYSVQAARRARGTCPAVAAIGNRNGSLRCVASLVNPYGYRLHVHVYRYLSSRWLMNHIDEFLSPNFHGVAQQCFVLLLLITIVALAVGKKPPLAHVLVLLFAAYSGLYASRNLPGSSLLLTLLVAPLLSQTVKAGYANSNLSSKVRAFLARWEGFGARMTAMQVSLRGHAWALLAVIAGLLICMQGGSLGSYRWMDAHFDTKSFRCWPAMSLSSATFAIQFLLLTCGADISFTGSLHRPKFSWMTVTISMEKNFLKAT